MWLYCSLLLLLSSFHWTNEWRHVIQQSTLFLCFIWKRETFYCFVYYVSGNISDIISNWRLRPVKSTVTSVEKLVIHQHFVSLSYMVFICTSNVKESIIFSYKIKPLFRISFKNVYYEFRPWWKFSFQNNHLAGLILII